MHTTTFTVSEMSCGHCTSAIAKAIAAVDSSAQVISDIPSQTVKVSSAAPLASLQAAIEEAGYPVKQVASDAAPVTAAPAKSGCCCGSGGCH